MASGWKRAELQWAKWSNGKRHPSQGVEHEDLSGPHGTARPVWWTAESKDSHYCPKWLADAIRQSDENGERYPELWNFLMLTMRGQKWGRAVRLLCLRVDFNEDDPDDAMLALIAAKKELEACRFTSPAR